MNNKNLIGAVMASTIGLLFYNVMPIYLGYLMEAKSLNYDQIGYIASAFFLAFSIPSASGYFWVRSYKPRIISFISIIFIALFFSEIFFYFSSLTFLHPVLVGIDNWQLTMWKICGKNYVRISTQITKNGYKTINWFNFDSAWKFQTVEKCSNGRRIDKDLIFPTRIFIKFIFNILI